MEFLKKMFVKRGMSFWFMLAAFVFSLAVLILYLTTGTNDFTPSLSGRAVALMGIALAGAALFSAFEVKLGKYAVYLIGLWAWLEFIISQANYLANIFVSIDGSTFSAGFLMTLIFGALAWVCSLVSAILQKRELGSFEEKANVTLSGEGNNV